MAGITDADWDHYDRYDAFTKCLEDWDPATDPVLFTSALALSPRFAFIPKVAESGDQAPAVWFGHGLLGSHKDVESFDDVANDGRFALLASDWSGMASDDLNNVLDVLSSGNVGNFRTVTDRLQIAPGSLQTVSFCLFGQQALRAHEQALTAILGGQPRR